MDDQRSAKPGAEASQVAKPIRTFNDAAHRYSSTGPGTALSYARERFEDLTYRDLSVRSIAKLKARGEYDPVSHSYGANLAPLTGDERLEVLALGELLARYYRHPAEMHHAIASGAAWADIAEAVNGKEDQVRHDYVRWANGQHQLWLDYDGKFGMSHAEHSAAIQRATEPDAPPQIEAGH